MNRSTRKNKSSKRRTQRLPSPMTNIILRATVPDTVTVPLIYHAREVFAGNIFIDNIFNLNSCFDPDRTGVGHQPLGFDQWSTFYGRYRVDKVHLDITAVNHSSTVVTTTCLLADNTTSALVAGAVFESACESPFSKVFMLSESGGDNLKRMRVTYNLNQIIGVSSVKYKSDDTYAALVSSSPSEIVCLHVAAADLAFTSNIEMFYDIKLTYITTFYDRVPLSQS